MTPAKGVEYFSHYMFLEVQGGPLSVINGVITPISRVITPVTHLLGHVGAHLVDI